MIIPDLSLQTIQTTLKNELNRIESERWKEIEMFLDYYENIETEKYIRPFFDSETLSSIPLFTQSIVRRFCKASSLVYGKSDDIQRHADEKYLELAKGLNHKCRQLEELNFLLGNMAFRTRYNPRKEQLQWDLVPFFHVYFVDGMQDEPKAIMYPIQRSGYGKLKKELYAFWSVGQDGEQGYHFLIDSNGKIYSINEGNTNPYKNSAGESILPFTFTRRQPRVRDFFGGNASDIIQASQQLDLAMTELALAVRMGATGGVKWISGLDVNPSEPIKIGVDKVLVLPSDTQFNMTAPSGGLKEIIDTTKFFIESVASNNHLNISFADVGNSAISGEALKILNIESIEQREASVEDTWRSFEQERFDVDRAVLMQDANVKISEDYYTDFPEMSFPISEIDELAVLEKKKQLGIITQREMLLHYNPDADEAEINSKLGEIKEERSQEATATAPQQPQGSLVERLINA